MLMFRLLSQKISPIIVLYNVRLNGFQKTARESFSGEDSEGWTTILHYR